jgi:hypothetical protein
MPIATDIRSRAWETAKSHRQAHQSGEVWHVTDETAIGNQSHLKCLPKHKRRGGNVIANGMDAQGRPSPTKSCAAPEQSCLQAPNINTTSTISIRSGLGLSTIRSSENSDGKLKYNTTNQSLNSGTMRTESCIRRAEQLGGLINLLRNNPLFAGCSFWGIAADEAAVG